MARGFSNALRIALGGVAGGLEGYGAKQERLARTEQLNKANERQSMLDALDLVDRGALPSTQRQAVEQAAIGEIGKSVLSAINMAGGGPAIGFNEQTIAQGAGRIGKPAAQFTVGGVQYDLPDPEQRRKGLQAQELAAQLSQRRRLTQAEQEEKDKALNAEATRVQAAYGTSYGRQLSFDEARQIAAGRRPAELDLYTKQERKNMGLEEQESLANIAQSNAAAAASRAAAELSRAGGRRTPQELRDNLITAAAKFATTVDESTGAMPTKEQVQQFYTTLSSLAGINAPLEEEFSSPAEISKITQLRKQQFSDEEIRAALRRAKAASQSPR